jgi:hypothetical protein
MCTLMSIRVSLRLLRWFVALLTIAVHCTMRARLFAVAFDFLPSTFVACSGNPAPFLEMRWWLGAIELSGGVR